MRGTKVDAAQPHSEHKFVGWSNIHLFEGGIIIIDDGQLRANDAVAECVKDEVIEDANKQCDHHYGNDSSSESTIGLVIPVALKSTMSEDITL